MLGTRQHQGRIRLHGEAAVLGVLAVVDLDQVALLQVTQQALAGLFQGLGRYRVTLLAGTQEEVGDVGGQPEFFLVIRAPQAKAAVVALHAQQVLDAHLDLALAHVGRLTLDTQALERRGIGVQRRIQATGGLFQAAVRVGFEGADLLGQVQRRAARQCQ
ncbi:hypothetical protein D9M71_492550 [compost metagenome]